MLNVKFVKKNNHKYKTKSRRLTIVSTTEKNKMKRYENKNTQKSIKGDGARGIGSRKPQGRLPGKVTALSLPTKEGARKVTRE